MSKISRCVKKSCHINQVTNILKYNRSPTEQTDREIDRDILTIHTH